MLVTCRQMQETEERAFAEGVSAADLMDKAGLGIARLIESFFPKPGTLLLYLGSGNNAGDALVIAHDLRQKGWQILARLSCVPEKLKPLAAQHWQSLQPLSPLTERPTVEPLRRPLVLLDGLLGVGAQGPLRPQHQALAAEMNELRQNHGAVTVAIDFPSGLDGDTGLPNKDCVIADITATIAFGKQGLVADTAINHVGRLALIPLPDLARFQPEPEAASPDLITPEFLRRILPRRQFDFHKGQAGRVGIVAGSRGFYGAAELCCRGALRAGAGLVTLFVKESAYDILARRVPPEVMVQVVKDYRDILDLRFDALGIGPGLGFDHEDEYLALIEKSTVPAVLDADALTALSRKPKVLSQAQTPHLLTPHPGEMARLMPEAKTPTRLQQTQKWIQDHPEHTLLLKGSRTLITANQQPPLYNTTGHPGMSTGGMGDVLTGVCSALLGQGLSPYHAAALGAWLCGRAAERYAMSQAQESTLPSDVIQHLGAAWAEI